MDQLLYSGYFDKRYDEPFNLCKLIAGSEGTLAFITGIEIAFGGFASE